MANETLISISSAVKTIVTSGASVANNAMSAASATSYDVVADGGGYPNAKFVGSFTFATAPTENTVLSLYAQPHNIDGTNDADAPETTRGMWVGNFVLNNVTTAQYIELIAYDVPWNAYYFIYNNGTGQALGAGWTLKVTPFTYKPAA